MTLLEARELLDKYWKGESTLKEEQQLKRFFQTHRYSLPADLKQAAGLFSFYEMESAQTAGNISLPVAEMEEETKHPRRTWRRYAAVFIVLMAGVLSYIFVSRPAGIGAANSALTKQEQAQAFETTKEALQLVAANLNAGKAEMQKLAVFSEVQQKIAGK